MSEELKSLAGELRSTWEDAKQAFDVQAEDIKSLSAATGETKQFVERVESRLDDIEVRMEKSQLDTQRGGRSEVKAAFIHALKHGALPEGFERKDLIVANDPQAGYLVPTEYAMEIIRGITEFSPVRAVARVRSISTQSLQQPKRTGLTTATWRGETQAFTETNPTVGVEEIPTHELGAFIDISQQLLEDSMIDLEGYVRDEIAESFGTSEGTAFVSGSGVGRPEGFLTALNGAEVETATNDTFVADDVLELFHAPKTQYANRGAWMLNRGILKVIRKFKGTDNYFFWAPSLDGQAPATILGAPYYESPDMAATVADGAKILAFGDWQSGYTIVDRVQFTMLRDPFSQGVNGLVRFYARRRVGGQVVLPEALKILKVK